MGIILVIFRLIAIMVIAYFVGKLVSKLKLPSILGWLITGIVFGPHAISLINQEILDASWYQTIIHILECIVGIMIGTELVWNKIKKSGKAIIITTLTQSLGTFILVSLVFGVVLYLFDLPIYLAFIFGGIALATAPAPALSIVREFKTSGPVTNTLIPMAALDDIVGCIVFFTTIAVVAGSVSNNDLPSYMIPLTVILPLVIGAVIGLIGGFVLKKERKTTATLILLMGTILIASGVGFIFNNVILPKPVLNFMLIGMAFSTTFANMVSEKRLEQIMNGVNPILGICIMIVILNLGAPLDYHLIVGAGVFTVVYIVARAFGKYFGAYFGASITRAPETVKKYLGFTLLPHSGVSLVFTGIAVSVLIGPAPECAQVIQGTIAAAAIINEIIAVIFAKKGFEWAGEFGKEVGYDNITDSKNVFAEPVITISRQYGSGGREIGQRLAKQLKIPFYDSEIVELAAKESTIDKNLFENFEKSGVGGIRHELSAQANSELSLTDKVFMEQSKVIKEVAEKGPCIIVGRCADYVLKERNNVIKVFIYGDIKCRENRVKEIYKETNETEKIAKIDKQRSSYYNFYSGQKFGDAENYDICLDSSSLGIDNCINIIKSLYHNKEKI